MPARPTIQLARIFGIRIGVGMSWFFVLFIYIFLFIGIVHNALGGSYTTTFLVTVASVLAFFASLVLHELGHALVARRNGMQVLGIELWALGGVTRTTGSPQGPGAQFRVAAAGPAVTLLIVVAAIIAGEGLAEGRPLDSVVEHGHVSPVILWLGLLMLINLLVLGLNVLPAYPLDGSQMTQAIIWKLTGDRNAAARITGRISQGVAFALGMCAIYAFSQPQLEVVAVLLLLFAVFLYQGGGAAVMQGSVGQRIQRLTVADIMDREPEVIPGELRLLDAHEQFFARYRKPWFAVVDGARHFLGVVRSERLDAEIAAGRPALSVSDVLEGDTDTEQPMRIAEDEPLEAVLRSQALGRWGGVVAVDGDGVLRGVVTLAQIRKALRVSAGP